MKLKTIRSLCLDIIIILIPSLIILSAFPYILSILSPFITGFFLYLIAKPLSERLKRIFPPSLSSFLSLFLFSAVIFFILRALFMLLISELSSLTESTERLYRDTIPFISEKTAFLSSYFQGEEIFTAFFDTLRTQIFEIITKLSASLLGFAKNIPSMLIYVFVSVFTAFFLLKDSKKFFSSLKIFFGEKMYLQFSGIKESLLDTTFSYLKALLIIEGIIFSVLFIGLTVLNQRYALLTALFTAVIDAIPVLGTGIVLVPMSIFNFLTGKTASGWGLLALYGAAVVTRQFCEPKILGKKLGIHPMLTIFSLYAGLKIFGGVGLIMAPFIAILLKNGAGKVRNLI